MSPSDHKPMASYENDTSSVDKIPSYLPYSSNAEPRSCIFWDVVDFPLPNGVDPVSIYQRIKTFLESKGPVIGELSIILYVDGKENIIGYDAFKKADGFTILSREGDDYPIGDSMLVDIVLWAMENPATYFEPLNLMVISKNIEEQPDFLNALEALEGRYYNVLLTLPELRSSSTKLHTVDFQWLSASLLGVVEPVDQSGTFHHLPESRDETVGSDGLASVVERWNMYRMNVFCGLGYSKDLESLCTYLTLEGYERLYVRTYTCIRDGPVYPSYDCLHEEIIVDEKANVTRMLLDVLFWAMNNHDVPQILMIIAEKSTKWDRVIKGLRGCGFIVIFGPSAEVVSSSLDTITSSQDVKCHQSQNYGRKMRTGQKEFALNDLVAFWLVEDNFPSDTEKFSYHVMRALTEKGYRSFTSMTAYVYKSKVSDAVRRDYGNAGVAVKYLPEESEESEEYKLGRKTLLSVDIIESSTFYWRCANFLVTSKPFKSDAMWKRVIQCLELRGCNLLCELPDYMYTFGSCLWSANELFAN